MGAEGRVDLERSHLVSFRIFTQNAKRSKWYTELLGCEVTEVLCEVVTIGRGNTDQNAAP